MVRFSILSCLRPGWWSTAGEGGLHGGEVAPQAGRELPKRGADGRVEHSAQLFPAFVPQQLVQPFRDRDAVRKPRT